MSSVKICLFIILHLVFFFSLSFAQTPETIQIDTYYPAPYGVYAELTTTSNTYLATEGGNVGIGTTSPTSELHIERDNSITETTLRIANPSGDPGVGIQFITNSDDYSIKAIGGPVATGVN